MKRIILVLIYLGFISCGERNVEPVHRHLTVKVENIGSVDSITPVKTSYATLFDGNEVTKMAKAINEIFQAKNGYYWFASNGEGVYCYDGEVLLQFTTKDGLSDNQVFSIQQDKQGLIWFVTAGGISFFDGKKISDFPGPQFQIDRSLDMASDDDLWFVVGGGVYRYNRGTYYYLLLPVSDLDHLHTNPTNPKNPDARKLNAYSIYSSLKDTKGNLWFGTQTLGVCRYDGKSFSWITDAGLSGPAVLAIFEDSNGNIWFGNNGSGLFRYDGNYLVNFTKERKLGNPDFIKNGKSAQGSLARVWSINEDNKGNIWIGTIDTGVWRYDGINLTNFTTKDGLSSNSINTIYKDNKGFLWIGTDGAGVCVFNGVSFSNFTF